MKFRFPIIILLLISVFMMASCTPSRNIIINVNMTCEEFQYKSPDLGNEFEIDIGDQIKAKMCVNATSGYSWNYTIENEDVMEFLDHEYIEPEPDGEFADAPGVDIWLFKAKAEGDTTIDMAYSNGLDTMYTYTMEITVMQDEQK